LPVAAAYHDSELLTVQGLGVQGKAIRYEVKSIRLGYLNDAGTFTTFTVPIPGIRTDLLVTDEVVDKALYLHVDRNLSLPVTAAMLRDLYQVETSSSALDRWKAREAQALPAIGRRLTTTNPHPDWRAPTIDFDVALGAAALSLTRRRIDARIYMFDTLAIS